MQRIFFSVDVESWVYSHTPALQALDSSGRKEEDKGYVYRSVAEILDLCDTYRARITFFLLGETCEWYPNIVEDILARGHEIGFHGFRHLALDDPDTLEEELRRSSALLKVARDGFRAPFMRVSEACLRLLKERGFRYDSSTYGPTPFEHAGVGLKELPVSTLPFGGRPAERGPLPHNFGAAIRRFELPYGAAMMVPFLRGAVPRFLNRALSRYGYAHLFLHNLQISPPDTGLFRSPRFLIQNPGCIQFTISSRNVIENILKRYAVSPLREYLDN